MFLCQADIAIMVTAAEVLPFDPSKKKLKTLPKGKGLGFGPKGPAQVRDVTDWKETVQGGICPADDSPLRATSAHGNEFRWMCPKCKRTWDDQGMFKGYQAPSGAALEGPGAKEQWNKATDYAVNEMLPKPKSAPRSRFTRKHFETLANVLADLKTAIGPDTHREVAVAIAKALQKVNPRFDWNKFMRASGV